jgi:curved DNA-binding protein CbpA
VFYDQAKKHHPDTGGSNDGEKFRQINEAYEILSNRDLKSKYDRERNFNYE